MFLHGHNNIAGNLDFDKVVFNLGNFPQQATCRSHLITRLQGRYKLAVLLLPLGLRPNQQEVKHHKYQHERQHTHQVNTTNILGVRVTYKEIHFCYFNFTNEQATTARKGGVLWHRYCDSEDRIKKDSLDLSRCLPRPEFFVKALKLARFNRCSNPDHQRQVEMQVVDSIQP